MTPHATERRRWTTLALIVGALLAIISAVVNVWDLNPPEAAASGGARSSRL
jgi:hypothetical protein